MTHVEFVDFVFILVLSVECVHLVWLIFKENNMIKILQLIMTSGNSIILPAEQFKPEEPLACFCEMDRKVSEKPIFSDIEILTLNEISIQCFL